MLRRFEYNDVTPAATPWDVLKYSGVYWARGVSFRMLEQLTRNKVTKSVPIVFILECFIVFSLKSQVETDNVVSCWRRVKTCLQQTALIVWKRHSWSRWIISIWIGFRIHTRCLVIRRECHKRILCSYVKAQSGYTLNMKPFALIEVVPQGNGSHLHKRRIKVRQWV